MLVRCRNRYAFFSLRREPDFSIGKSGQVLKEFLPEGIRDLVGFRERHGVVDPDCHFRKQAVSQPARLNRPKGLHPMHVLGGMADRVDNSGIDAVQHTRKNGARGLPDDTENRDGDKKPDNRISERKAELTPAAPITTARLVNPSVRA